jgi:hypothetical protein
MGLGLVEVMGLGWETVGVVGRAVVTGLGLVLVMGLGWETVWVVVAVAAGRFQALDFGLVKGSGLG